ncbi:hypothetical protein FJ208_01710 [Candidatus Gribaldobacteria bacterium]|nr:hypothetical protein [Candidatus Gribaldobacteria bacterium]
MLYLVFIFALIFLVLLFWPSNLKAAITGAPFLPTPKKVIRQALKIANLRQGELFFDLGSGDGRALLIAEKDFQANAIGYEMGLTFFVWSKINLFFKKTKKVKIFRKSFYQANLREADVIFMFLTPKAFVKLKTLFEEQLRPGCRIVTFSSPLGFWPPHRIISLQGIKEKLFLYIKN